MFTLEEEKLKVKDIRAWQKALIVIYGSDLALKKAIRLAHPPETLRMPFLEKRRWYDEVYQRMNDKGQMRLEI